jgi:hypothetical protein
LAVVQEIEKPLGVGQMPFRFRNITANTIGIEPFYEATIIKN